MPASDSLKCICGWTGGRRKITTAQGLTMHQKSCKKWLAEEKEIMTEGRAALRETGIGDFKRRKIEGGGVIPGPNGDKDTNSGPSNTEANEHTAGGMSGDADEMDVPEMGMERDHHVSPGVSPGPHIEPTLPPVRNRRRPRHYNDILPQPPAPPTSWMSHIRRVTLHVAEPLPEPTITPPNLFGLFREYMTKPSYEPDTPSLTPQDPLVQRGIPPEHSMFWGNGGLGEEDQMRSKFWPFSNFTEFSFASLWSGNKTGQISDAFLDSSIQMLTDPRFATDDLKGWSARKMKQQLDSMDKQVESDAELDLPEEVLSSDDWNRNVNVVISIPEGKKFWTAKDGIQFQIPGLHYRPIVSIIKKVYRTAKNLHFTPFQLFHRRSDIEGDVERVYGELYTSPAYINEQKKLNRLPKIEYERIIAPLMFWSDSTHLTSFGTAKLWPIYALFGSQSKVLRGKPSAHVCHHLAYIPSLPDSIQDIIREFTGGTAGNPPLLAHCKRELMHAIWKILLDDEFCKAYREGILITCADGITRLVYPRIFTYSADYPEKVLLATIRDMGLCPCPRCYIQKTQINQMGVDCDMAKRKDLRYMRVDDNSRCWQVQKARKLIYEKGIGVTGKGVENILKPKSRVPTLNAFSERLQDQGFDFHSLFVVDFLHEIELGVWKATLTHLIRLLHAQNAGAAHELNKRYREIPTFGGDTIRRFSDNVSELKRLAARDYEDILQCSLPAFEGLLEEPYNSLLCDLLFIFCYWHGVAKLRMHTDGTIELLSQLTKQFGSLIRKFRNITAGRYITVELPREKEARLRRQADAISKGQQSTVESTNQTKKKGLNLNTYKFHSMGDYPHIIRNVGSIESYSTQRGELEHRIVKQRYSRVWKKNTALSLTRMERHDNNMRRVQAMVQLTVEDEESLLEMDTNDHWFISPSEKRNRIDISTFLMKNRDDPATTNFYSLLRDHLLARILGRQSDDDEINFTYDQRMRVLIVNGDMFEHARLCINYTSYDLRRCQDSLNPKGDHRDIMVHAQDDPNSPTFHPYWYARIIGIYHVNVVYMREDGSMEPKRKMHFLWVRWFGRDLSYKSGPKFRRLDKIGFVHDEDDTDSFGFLDPADVIRGIHLIPAFNEGKTTELLVESIARRYDHDQEDWQFFYVNRFVDRDMLMRYMGGGIGHSIHYKSINTPPQEVEILGDSRDEEEPQEPVLSDTEQGSQLDQDDIPEPLAEDFEIDEGEEDKEKDINEDDWDEEEFNEEELANLDLEDDRYDSP